MPSPSPAPVAPQTSAQSPCLFNNEPPAAVCGAVTSPSACSVRAAYRIQCSSGAASALAAHDAHHAAVVILGGSTWLTEFAPDTAPQSRELYGGRLLRVALAATRDGGYRLLGADSGSPRIVSIYTPSPSSHDAATPPEWIEMRDTRAIGDLIAASDGRFHATIFNGSSPGPLRLLSRSTEGAWSDRLITERRLGPPTLALDATGRAVVSFAEYVPTAPYAALRYQVGEQPAATITPWSDNTLLGTAIPRDATVPVVAYATRNASRIAVVDERGRVRAAVTLPSRFVGPQGCTDPVLDPLAADPPSQCRSQSVSNDPFVLAAGGNGTVWVVNVEHHVDTDQRATMHCMPVDPPGRTGRRWVPPPPSCRFDLTTIADRSFAELVVQRLDTRARRPTVVERARVRLSLPATAHRVMTNVAEADGVLHVLVAEPFREPSAGVYLALDETMLAQ